MSYDTELESPLCCRLRGGVLQIEVGLNRLNGNKYHPTIKEFKIISPRKWGEDIIKELEREEEDGSSPLRNLLDNTILAAYDNGSDAVTEKKGKKQAMYRDILEYIDIYGEQAGWSRVKQVCRMALKGDDPREVMRKDEEK